MRELGEGGGIKKLKKMGGLSRELFFFTEKKEKIKERKNG